MTPDKLNLALAKWDGWHDFPCIDRAVPPGNTSAAIEDCRYIPRYTSSLDAVHELEKKVLAATVLGESPRTFEYAEKLKSLLYQQDHDYYCESADFAILHATALQRCEALARVIGVWQD